MDSQEQQKTQTVSVLNPYLLRLKCFLCQALNPNVNDENNNLKKEETTEKSFNPISKLPLYTCPDCEAKIRLEEKEIASSSTVTSQENEEESDRMIIVPDTSSEDNDDECWCQTCHSTEQDSDIRQYWHDLSHIIKCIYRATDKQFQENQFSDDISKAKDYVKKLTDRNAQDLFDKLESIVFEYVKEIRSQVLERFHTCSKTSHDVQLFISFLLDEYHMFIQAASNVSTILSYFEEKYLKTFSLTWLLFNKHLYEKSIYMDRKIQHSMSTMIDFLQPNNEENTDYSPAEYTQLLNRFLAFDEEMSEIACLYKDSQAKRASQTSKQSTSKKCQLKKKKKKKSTKTSVDIPTSSQQGSNGSSIGSGNGGDDESSISSFDDYLLDNDPTSSFYIQEDEQEELRRLILGDEDPNEQLLKDLNEQLLKDILESCSPMTRIQQEIYQSTFNPNDNKQQQQQNSTLTMENQRWIQEIIQNMQSQQQSDKSTMNEQTKNNSKSNETSSTTKKSSSSKTKSSKSSHRRKDNPPTITSTTATTTTTIQIPKKSIPADIFLPRSVADLSAKIQSVSFTAGTFGSITSTNPNDLSASSSSNCSTTTLTAAKTTTSSGQTRLSINLTRKPGAKTNEHGGQKIAEALFNELTGFSNEESTINSRKKDSPLFKKSKQHKSSINETSINSSSNPHSFFNSSNKSDSNPSSSSTAYNNLDQLLRHAASNTDASEAALHSILSSFHSPSCLNSSSSSSKSPIASKTQEKIQTILAQQQQQQKKNLSSTNTTTNNNSKHCEFCCCDYSEGRNCSTSTCLHLSSNATNGPITSCVTCMALPGSTTTTTSVMGTTITGAFNPRDVEMKERLKLKLSKKKVQDLTEQQQQQQQKKNPVNNKKQTVQNNQIKTKEILLGDQNDIDDLVRFIDGNQSSSTNNHHHNEHQTSNHNQESTSKKNKKKKDKQTKTNNNNNNNTENKNQKKQNSSNTNQSATNSQQASRSASSSSSTTKIITVSNPTVTVETQQPLSKRKQKAKLKLEQQQKQAANSVEESSNETVTTTAASAPVCVPPSSVTSACSASYSSSSQGTNTTRTSVDLPFENIDSPEQEEEVNWITISRKQSKHKPTSTSVPSLLAAPVQPVVPTNKQQPQQQRQSTTNNTKKTPNTTNNSPSVQPKIASSHTPSESISTTNKQQYHNSTAAPPRLQNVLKNHVSHQLQKLEPLLPSQSVVHSSTSSNLWMNNNIHESISSVIPSTGTSSSAVLSTTSHYAPSPTSPSPAVPPLLPSNNIVRASSSSSSVISEGLPPSNYWDPNGYFLPISSQSTIVSPTVPGPVQRPNPLFSPAPGPVNHSAAASRCIQRPSPEPRSSSTNSVSFPLYSPMNYAVGSSTSTWNDTPVTNTHDSQWNYSQIEQSQIGLSTNVTDFPLYDPFHSGAGLTIPSTTQNPLLSNGFSENFGELYGIQQENEFNEMDALDKEIEDFKKFCFESAPLETRDKVQVNSDRCFIRQA